MSAKKYSAKTSNKSTIRSPQKKQRAFNATQAQHVSEQLYPNVTSQDQQHQVLQIQSKQAPKKDEGSHGRQEPQSKIENNSQNPHYEQELGRRKKMDAAKQPGIFGADNTDKPTNQNKQTQITKNHQNQTSCQIAQHEVDKNKPDEWWLLVQNKVLQCYKLPLQKLITICEELQTRLQGFYEQQFKIKKTLQQKDLKPKRKQRLKSNLKQRRDDIWKSSSELLPVITAIYLKKAPDQINQITNEHLPKIDYHSIKDRYEAQVYMQYLLFRLAKYVVDQGERRKDQNFKAKFRLVTGSARELNPNSKRFQLKKDRQHDSVLLVALIQVLIGLDVHFTKSSPKNSGQVVIELSSEKHKKLIDYENNNFKKFKLPSQKDLKLFMKDKWFVQGQCQK